ncbi:MAG: histidine phosphatase family protein [Chloroflexi bacterium]|nr:histidine phosphatase family protein [Chloroflexota bacterium]
MSSQPPGDPIGYYFREALLIGGEATRLYLVRHAQSQENTGEDLTRDDPHLTEVGWEQARRLGQRFARQKVEAVYASPLARARDTAQPIAEATGVAVRVEPGLTEVSLGTPESSARLYTGEAAAELARRIAQQGTWDAFPGSEGSRAARQRVGPVMDRIIRENEGKRVALVTHAGFIQTYVSLVLGLERDFIFYPFNASITSVRAKGDRRVLWRLNDVGHLDGMPAGFGGIS